MKGETMSTTTKTLTWPTEAECEDIEEKLRPVYEEVEQLVNRVKTLLHDWHEAIETTPEHVPTLEDIGALWSFAKGLELEGDQLTTAAGALTKLLSDVDDMRLTVRARAARTAATGA